MPLPLLLLELIVWFLQLVVNGGWCEQADVMLWLISGYCMFATVRQGGARVGGSDKAVHMAGSHTEPHKG